MPSPINDLEYKSKLTLVGIPKITKIRFDKLGDYISATDYNLTITNKITKETKTSCKVIQNINIYSLEENKPFSVEFEAECDFKWDEDISENLKNTFISYSAPANILSYVRPILTQILIYSGLPDFRLPILNMFEIVRNSENK